MFNDPMIYVALALMVLVACTHQQRWSERNLYRVICVEERACK